MKGKFMKKENSTQPLQPGELHLLLPIGSVVTLKGSEQKMMITGLLPSDGNRHYDYIAVPFPGGYVDEKTLWFFNHDDINVIWCRGYDTLERSNYICGIKEVEKLREHRQEDFCRRRKQLWPRIKLRLRYALFGWPKVQ